MIFVLPIIWILFGIGAAMAASGRGRSGCAWFLLGVLLGPFGLLFALLAPAREKSPATPPALPSTSEPSPAPLPPDLEFKTCPTCAETIKAAALKCRFCGHTFDPDEVAAKQDEIQAHLQTQARIQAGQRYCPTCDSWEGHDAYLPDGSFGPWCPRCQKPIQD